MSLLCRECDAYLVGSYQILCLLGHTKIGLVLPEESRVRQLVCQRHVVQPFCKIDQSRLQEVDADALIFAVVPGISSASGNFNGAYSMDQDGVLKENGNFNQAAYLTSVGVRITFPIFFDSLLTESRDWPNEVAAYKTAIERYRANVTQADLRRAQRQEQEETDRQERIREAERVEQLRQQHAGLIRSAAENALANRIVPLDVVRQLDVVGLLRPSTTFRSGSLFPGECSILRYEFGETEKHSGLLGFDENNALLSIDERYPVERQLYREGTVDTSEWVEIR